MPTLSTTLHTVIVYPDRARLIRQGALALEPGFHRLEVLDLPARLNTDSVRAAARGTARARLLGVQVQAAYSVEATVEQIRALEAELESLQDELRALDIQAELVKANRAALGSLAGHTQLYATALASGEMSLEAQAALFAGLRAQAQALDSELLHLGTRRRDVERRLQKTRSDLDRWRGTPRRERRVAVVEVEVLQAGELKVEVSYVVAGAGWKPLYDLRLVEAAGQNNGKPNLEVSYLAQVTQNTGEAWQDVALTLSTARPALAGQLPELDPWYVSPLPPPRPVMPPMAKAQLSPAPLRSMASAAPEEAVSFAAPVPIEMEAEVVTANVQSAQAAVTYSLPGVVTIPADGAPHKVTVARFGLEPRLDYLTAPRLVEAVYRRAQVTNASPYTWLPGTAALFSGEEFTGSLELELIAPDQEVELYLGPDDRVQVKRELKRREVDKRLIGGKRRMRYGYEISLENLLPYSVQVELQDQFPVARHEEIKVRLEGVEPKPNEQSELNILTWKFSLTPKEKRVVRFDFSLELPASMEIIGVE